MGIRVFGLGIGPAGSAKNMREYLASADLVVGGRDLLARFEDVAAEKLVVESPLSGVMRRISEVLESGGRVAVLADGDPLFFGVGETLARQFGPDRVRIEPGVSSLQVMAARLGIAWREVRSVSLHGRSDLSPLFSSLTHADRVAVLTDRDMHPGELARRLLERGAQGFSVWVGENLNGASERLRFLSLEEAAGTAFDTPNLALFLRTSPRGKSFGLGIEDTEFVREKGIFTKKPVRAVGLAELKLSPENTLWDLGAGCGGVSIEAACLLTRGRVLAVEKNPGRIGLIRENIRAFGALSVEPVPGEALQVMDGLPDPDRIFIGGGLGRGGEVLTRACERLKPGGRLVAHCILLDSLSRVRDHFKKLGWPADLTMVQAARGSELAGDLRLEGLNPVFIVAADKPRK